MADDWLGESGRIAAPFEVGDWLVEPASGALSRQDERVRLEPKVMDVLVCLAERAGRMVSKRELTDCVWQVEFISDNRLTRAIADLRRALGDDAADPRYIETVPTRGYRLVAEVSGLVTDTSPAAQESRFRLETADHAYTLKEGVNIIGRGFDADVRVDSEWVSRRHARIMIEGTEASIEDLGSKNGTFVRGARLREVAVLHDGDDISIGRGVVVLRFSTVLGSTRTQV